MPIRHEDLVSPCLSLDGEPYQGTILEVEGLSFTYPDGRKALDGVSLKIEAGEKVALVGPNGAGKSTFLLHINALLEGQGKITVAGLSLRKENLPVVRALVGLVFQNPDDQLFSPTVFEDVAFGPLHMGLGEEAVCARVEEALAQVHMGEYAGRAPYHLSTGEKKRIAIATVLSMCPAMLILDEPTAGLDPRSRRALIDLLAEMEISMLIATHDMLMVKELLPRVVILDGGRVAADGPTDSMLADDALLQRHGLEFP
jgi:cobalt/nickel transport system ATP-binding protein